MLGAASAVEAVACVKAITDGWVHPNVNLDDPEDDVDLALLVGPTKERLDVKVALSNSFGFGGASHLALVPVRPRSRGERRSLRTFPPPPPPLVAAPAAQQTRRVNSVRSSDGASPPAMETKSSGAAAADASIARAALRVEGPFKAMISGWS